MEKFGLFNALQTPFSLPDAADSQGSFADKIVSAFQAANQIAALFQNGTPLEPARENSSSPEDSATFLSSSPALFDSSAETSSAATAAPESFEQNKQSNPEENALHTDRRKKSCGDTYADFIRKQEAFSKKIGGGK